MARRRRPAVPWSARAMDEAGAALDALRPEVALTYAEAGGWGRALMLEARRRGIATAALQHGFIYRHWLNYLHEPDEMAPSPANPADRGFPRPDCTLIFDELTREHLEQRGHFPAEGLRVTGSARLDAIVAAARGFDPARAVRASRATGRRRRCADCRGRRQVRAAWSGVCRAGRGGARDARDSAGDQAAPGRGRGRPIWRPARASPTW